MSLVSILHRMRYEASLNFLKEKASLYFLLVNNFAVDGKQVGSIESKVLCRSVLDLYIGEQPFDERAKEDVRSKSWHPFLNSTKTNLFTATRSMGLCVVGGDFHLSEKLASVLSVAIW
ncbi:Fatty-acid-binding protein 1-like protein [Drosera capensis]